MVRRYVCGKVHCAATMTAASVDPENLAGFVVIDVDDGSIGAVGAILSRCWNGPDGS